MLYFRGGRKGRCKDVYRELDAFFHDLAETYKDAVAAVPQGGCRCLRFDDTVWAHLCSQKELDLAKQHGDDPTRLPEIYARVINEAIKNRPSDMTITTHVCRGNFRSPGFPRAVTHRLRGAVRQVNDDGNFFEYDTERAGGFEPLRFVPKGNKQIVLGLMTSKSGTAGEERGHHEAHQGGGELRRTRPVLPLAAVRPCLDRGRQRADRGRPMGQDEDDPRHLEGSVGLTPPTLPSPKRGREDEGKC